MIEWNDQLLNKLDAVIEDVIPKFMRKRIRSKVKSESEEYAKKRGSDIVEEDDVVQAFFLTAPTVLHDKVKAKLIEHGLSVEN
ncbi:MAG: PCP reductase family protein [Promethearchaeota archaeon]